MNQRTLILCDLIDAAKHLNALQDALTRAYVLLGKRRGSGAGAAVAAVRVARNEAFEVQLHDLIEDAITAAGRMP